MPDDRFASSLLHGARERAQRFALHFKLVGDVGDAGNRLLDDEEDKMQERFGPDRPLSLLMGTSLGKAMKTFQAIERLCLLGYGEDAAVLLRTNVNLLINTAYIVTDEKPNDRAAEYIADAWRQFRTFMRKAYAKEVDPADLPFPLERLTELSERWRAVSIETRAQRIPQHHYQTGYRFYSSIEHSDALAVGGYLGDHTETRQRIESGPSDSHIEVVLAHSADVMANILSYVCRYWKIERQDIFDDLGRLFREFTAATAKSTD
jgi:hypothetical protein